VALASSVAITRTEALNRQRHLAQTDGLTGLLNKTHVLGQLREALRSNVHQRSSGSVFLFDIDHFKTYNDTNGHPAGDALLRALAGLVSRTVRPEDWVCRYGGEEFCVLLPDTDSAGAARLAERMRQIIEALDFSKRPELRELRITSSFGVADTTIGVRNPTELIEKADQALYAAKNGGRNQVIESKDMNEGGAHADGDSARSEQASAQHDVLTGLPDRQMFLDKLRHAVVFPQKPDEYVAVMLLDIDMFKRVNNSMGHSAGDRLLRECGERLSNTLRGRDTIAKLARNEPGIAISRLGGDEFGVLLRGIDDIETITPLVERIQEAISAPFQLENMDISITSSIGIAVYPRDGERPEELLTNADIAMYSAKRSGPNGYQFFDVSMVAGNADDLQIESELRQALGRDQFVVFYQPQVELSEGRIIGAEALIRWQHPERGLVPPIKFIPMAERFGIIDEIGHWVLRQACNQARIWQTSIRPIPIAVNLSALQFRQPDLVLQIRTLLEEYRLEAHSLELEVTETVLMDDLDEVIPKIQELHEMGIKVSIDDFGVGYSSLAYLKRFAIDTLKIDRAFVQGIESSDDDRAIAEAVILLGRALNLDVIAEGVDKQEQLVKLKELGCNELQGYLFSPPVPAEEFDELLRQDVRLEIPRLRGPKLAATSAA
ncbi:MAG: bifunctional diguanylate cyclase/phosphodiesterase, partial [Gammaproteobacteria bacterium]|nr:bifunctional diguanylate cyclase/phosphodiesterase [Gammaproteobacteria bacterium]